KAGVRLVTLSPEREFGPEAVKSLSKGALELQLILERAAEESERKSDRLGAVWARKKERAREGVIMTTRLPSWIRRQGDKLVLIPPAAAAVKRICPLAPNGYGILAIIKKCQGDGVPAIGRKGVWTRSHVTAILKNRQAVGEMQPRKGNARDGEPVPGYFPAAV